MLAPSLVVSLPLNLASIGLSSLPFNRAATVPSVQVLLLLVAISAIAGIWPVISACALVKFPFVSKVVISVGLSLSSAMKAPATDVVLSSLP